MAIFRRALSNWGAERVGYEKIAIYPPISHFEMTGGVSKVVKKFRPSSMSITASVDFAFIS